MKNSKNLKIQEDDTNIENITSEEFISHVNTKENFKNI